MRSEASEIRISPAPEPPSRAKAQKRVPPLLPAVQRSLNKSLTPVSGLLARETDVEQRAVIIRWIHLYVDKLVKDNKIPVEQLLISPQPPRRVGQRSRAQGSKRRRLENGDRNAGSTFDGPAEVEDHDNSPAEVEDGDGSDVSTDEDEPITALSLPRGHKQRRQAKELTLSSSLLGITDGVSSSTMKERRDEFHRYLRGVQVQQTVNKRSVVEGFTAEQAIEVTNFFFEQMMGPRGLSHLASVMGYYTTNHPDEPDQGVAMRAFRLAGGDDKPIAVRLFFGTVSRQQALAQSNGTLFRMLHQNVLNMQVLERFNDLKDRLEKHDLELCDYLQRMGEKPGQGKGWASCLINHLTSTLGISNNAFNSLIAAAQGAQCLVSELCPGVLCLLPRGGAARLYRFGIQKMRIVLPELIRIVPELATVSELLYKNLFQPITHGQPLRMAGLKITGKESLLSKIQGSVKIGGGDTTIRGIIVEEVEEDDDAADSDEDSGGDVDDGDANSDEDVGGDVDDEDPDPDEDDGDSADPDANVGDGFGDDHDDRDADPDEDVGDDVDDESYARKKATHSAEADGRG